MNNITSPTFENNNNLKSTDFYSYEIDTSEAQSMPAISGKLIVDENCILFQEDTGETYTPIFPFEVTIFDKTNKIITLGKVPIRLGQSFMTAGYVTDPNPHYNYITKASNSCMRNKIAILAPGVSLLK